MFSPEGNKTFAMMPINHYIMKRLFLYFCISSFVFQIIRGQDAVSVYPEPVKKYQAIEGWGASLCWWANMVGKWEDEEKIDEIIDLITSPDGLNMNIFRYNIGGGDDPSHYSSPGNPGHMAKGKGIRAEMEGFKPGPDAPYNWSADSGQRKIMLKIKEKRPDAVFEAFSNSPPYWMTFSGCSAGNKNAGSDNLKPEYYEAFCDYLIRVCKYYKDTHKIEFKTLEPFNEPQTSYWVYKGGQEGCHFDISSQTKLLRVLYPKLQASGLNTVIAASDETSVGSFIKAMKGYINAGDITGKLGQINTHTYSAGNSERKEALELSRQIEADFWQSESGPIGISGNGLSNNLGLARRMFNDLRIMRPSAWLDWQIMEEHNNTWCQLRCSFENETYYKVKNFYVRMQVTRFIKQGYVVIESGNDNVLAAMAPENNELVLVILNNSANEKVFGINLADFYSTANSAKGYRTSSTEDCKEITGLIINEKQLSYTAPSETITTIVLPVDFKDYSQAGIIKGITFENDSLNGFSGNNIKITDNPKVDGLNNSKKALFHQTSEGERIVYSFLENFQTGEDRRYLHIMTCSPDGAEDEGVTTINGDAVTLASGNKWTDQVIDLGTGIELSQLRIQSSLKNAAVYLDNVCINGSPEPRMITGYGLWFDFESLSTTPGYRLISKPGKKPEASVVRHRALVGLNTSKNIFEYSSPKVTNEEFTEDTLVIQFESPLKINQQTSYLHVLVKSAGTKLNASVGGISMDKALKESEWEDLVMDLSSLSGEIVYELKLSVYGSTQLRTMLYVDDIIFNEQVSPRKFIYAEPAEGTYQIYNRNSGLVLSSGDLSQVVQVKADTSYKSPEQIWYLDKTDKGVVFSNLASGKAVTDNDVYPLMLAGKSDDLNNQTFSIEHIGNGFVKIVSNNSGKAFDVKGASTSAGAKAGLWNFGTGNNLHRQWAMIKTPVEAPNTVTLRNYSAAYVIGKKGKLEFYKLTGGAVIYINNINGRTEKQVVAKSDFLEVPLTPGGYFITIKDNTGIHTLKGIVF